MYLVICPANTRQYLPGWPTLGSPMRSIPMSLTLSMFGVSEIPLSLLIFLTESSDLLLLLLQLESFRTQKLSGSGVGGFGGGVGWTGGV